jgi:hypothetical protein
MKALLACSIAALRRLLHEISEFQIQRFAPMMAVGRSHHALASGIGVNLTRDVVWARSAVEVAGGLAARLQLKMPSCEQFRLYASHDALTRLDASSRPPSTVGMTQHLRDLAQ